jgi:hypothetical protein
MTQSPAEVEPKQLRELSIRVADDVRGQPGKESPPKK